MFAVSFILIFIAGIASVIIGMIWYNPRVFGTAWIDLSGMTPEQQERGKKNMPLRALFGLLASMLVAYVMSYFAIAWGVYDWLGALELAFWIWVGFVCPVLLGAVLWEGKPIRLFLINSSYWLVTLAVMAVIIIGGSSYFMGDGDTYYLPDDTGGTLEVLPE